MIQLTGKERQGRTVKGTGLRTMEGGFNGVTGKPDGETDVGEKAH